MRREPYLDLSLDVPTDNCTLTECLASYTLPVRRSCVVWLLDQRTPITSSHDIENSADSTRPSAIDARNVVARRLIGSFCRWMFCAFERQTRCLCSRRRSALVSLIYPAYSGIQSLFVCSFVRSFVPRCPIIIIIFLKKKPSAITLSLSSLHLKRFRWQPPLPPKVGLCFVFLFSRNTQQNAQTPISGRFAGVVCRRFGHESVR